MVTRRSLLNTGLMAGAGLMLPGALRRAVAQQPSAAQSERNKSLVRQFKEAQGTKDEAAVMREVLAPDSKRLRAGFEHLANNAKDQGLPSPGTNLRDAIPDRADVIEEMIAEGDQVGMLFRVTGAHRGDFYGIAPTGKKIDVYEAGIFRVADGKIVETWFMADEAGLLKQLGASLPPRKDGKRIAPPVTGAGEDPDAVVRRLEASPLGTPEDRNRLMVARSKGSAPAAGDRTPDYRGTRAGFQHLRDYGVSKGVGDQTITVALPDRRDRIDGFLAEGDRVWMRFKVAGTHGGNLYGMPPTGIRVEAPEIGIMQIVGGKWKQTWYFGDELGLMLQLGALHMLGT
jgi:predicted ester cyclase